MVAQGGAAAGAPDVSDAGDDSDVQETPEVKRPSSRKSTTTSLASKSDEGREGATTKSPRVSTEGVKRGSHHPGVKSSDTASGVQRPEVTCQPTQSSEADNRPTRSQHSTQTDENSETSTTSKPPKKIWRLDDILNETLKEDSDEEEEGGLPAERGESMEYDRRPSVSSEDPASADRQAQLFAVQTKKANFCNCSRIVDLRVWSLFFMLLTFYALFATDLDLIFGDKESKYAFSIVTTVVFGLFFLEIVMFSCSRANYTGRAFFWLDLIALLSLLPDTWLVQHLILGDDSAFAAGKSSKIGRVIRVVARSAKATRLNRLTRIVRVAAMLPRLASLVGKQRRIEEERKILDKKLRHIFDFLDEDMDGIITQEAFAGCLAKLKASEATSKDKDKASDNEKNTEKDKEKDEGREQTDGDVSTASAEASTKSKMNVKPTSSEASTKSQAQTDGNSWSRAASSLGKRSRSVRSNTAQGAYQDVEELDYELFKTCILADEQIGRRMHLAVKQQVRKSNNSQNIASKHSEDVGVKVALGVLLLLLILSVLEPSVEDRSATLGLEYVDRHVHQTMLTDWTDAVDWPVMVREHSHTWSDMVSNMSQGKRQLLYLDLQKRVFCNELTFDPRKRIPCYVPANEPLKWYARGSLKDIDKAMFSSDVRVGDMEFIEIYRQEGDWRSHADIGGGLSLEEKEERMTSSAVLSRRTLVEEETRMSMITTIVVILLIIVGVVVLAKDLNFLSVSLLTPLRSLAEEMQSIVQMQLRALADDRQVSLNSCTEIRMIQKIFNNMKKAVKSWGKYVPWPVVQLLFSAGVDAEFGVKEREVSIFFSDIAGFTTIVESIQPEQSLLLLSRYFNDMSSVIDEHQGIVIEFIGDAILAVYGAPLKNNDHPTACVKAALKMLAALDNINKWSNPRGLPEINIRCGVHTGRVLIGNMGFRSRMKYGVVGEHANVPDRLEELNKTYGTNLLISHSTYRRLAEDAFVIRPIDYLILPGSDGTRKAQLCYQVMARERSSSQKHRLRPVAAKHRKAMKKYRDSNFREAIALFTEVNAIMQDLEKTEEDKPATLMIKRCEAYISQPPPQGWEGVWERA